MSSGSRVRREGTIAMSSNPYARRPFLPRPISISIASILCSAADGGELVAGSRRRCGARPKNAHSRPKSGAREPRFGRVREHCQWSAEHSNGRMGAMGPWVCSNSLKMSTSARPDTTLGSSSRAASGRGWSATPSATPPLSDDAPHIYIKPSAPFTSGNIHIGHVRSYSIGDAYARFRRARGRRRPVLVRLRRLRPARRAGGDHGRGARRASGSAAAPST